MLISNMSPATANIPYQLVIDNMINKLVGGYLIQMVIYFADGTYCEQWITNNVNSLND